MVSHMSFGTYGILPAILASRSTEVSDFKQLCILDTSMHARWATSRVVVVGKEETDQHGRTY